MYQQQFLTTDRLTTAYYRAGEGHEKKLLLLHGNVTSSVFFLPVFPLLEKDFDVVAPDLRCFGDSSTLPIDATRGFRDWTDDVAEFAAALGWEKFALLGWSMGGCAAMQYAIDRPQQLAALILLNPGSPYGFGGTKDIDGKPYDPPGLASGAGAANPQLVQALAEGQTDYLRTTLTKTVFFKPDFKLEPAWEDRLVEAIAKTKVGEGLYPGDVRQVPQWPFVAAGARGVCNTMSIVNADLSVLAEVDPKPPILWIRGDSDTMVSDTSICDLAYLGKLGAVPGWPGEEVAPPQPMVAQTRHVLDLYAAQGGRYQEVVITGGHGCHLESPQAFADAIKDFLA